MENYIIIGIVVVIAAVGVYWTVKHFKGQGGCCGGGGYRPRKKKLSGVLYVKTFAVGGMHCDHCKARVEELVNDMPGLAGTVDLKKGVLTVSYTRSVDDELIAARIERAGYTVVATPSI